MNQNEKSHDQFEWTPGGYALLNQINEIIAENGGIEKMYLVVKAENEPNLFRVNKRKMEEVFLMIIKYNISHNDAAAFLGLKIDDFKRRFSDFKKKALPF